MYVYLLIPPRVTRLPSRLFVFFYIFSFLPYLHIYILLSRIYLLLSFLHISYYYLLYYILSYFLPYPTFFFARPARLARFTSLISLSSYLLSTFYFYTQSLSPLISTSVSLSFIPFSLSFLFLSSPPLFSFACASFSSDVLYFRYPFFASSFLIQHFPNFCPIHVPMILPLPDILDTCPLPFPNTNLPSSHFPYPISRYCFVPFLFPSHI